MVSINHQLLSDEDSIPQVILLDTTNSPHLADFRSRSNNLDSNVRAGLNGSIFVIRKLGRRSVGIPFNIARNQLSHGVVNTTMSLMDVLHQTRVFLT